MPLTHPVLRWVVVVSAAIVVLVAVIAFGVTEARKAYWDKKVVEMCEQQGGIKVFQKLQLAPGTYDKLLDERKRIRLPAETVAKSGDMYQFTLASEFVVTGDLQIRKVTQRVIQRPELKVLAEQTSFARVGGDLLMPHPTSFACPQPDDMFEQTFSRG